MAYTANSGEFVDVKHLKNRSQYGD